MIVKNYTRTNRVRHRKQINQEKQRERQQVSVSAVGGKDGRALPTLFELKDSPGM